MVAIFSDHYLFKRLYGIEKLDGNEANDLLSQLGVHNKTRILDREFETIDLSEGQRKRLALLVALLEKRPIMLLDEWAANQDLHFRRKFIASYCPHSDWRERRWWWSATTINISMNLDFPFECFGCMKAALWNWARPAHS